MDNPQTNLDPLVRRLAEHYGFLVEFDEVLSKWIIQNSYKRSTSFYWNSESTVDVFFDDLRAYFIECGESYGWH